MVELPETRRYVRNSFRPISPISPSIAQVLPSANPDIALSSASVLRRGDFRLQSALPRLYT
jgi:hypothetical protein